MNERVKTALEATKRKFSWKKNDFGRSMLEFEWIARHINSTRGKEHKFWCEVMDEWKKQEESSNNE